MKSLSLLSLSIFCFLVNIGIDTDVLSDVSDILNPKKEKVESHIEYDGFLDLCKEVEDHRAERLIKWKTFLKYSKDPNTVIIDTRSRAKFKLRHLKGAVNLPFSEFSASALLHATGYDTEKRILIYCNNNFIGDQLSFRAKGISSDPPPKMGSRVGIDAPSLNNSETRNMEVLLKSYKSLVGNGPSLALNLPTYITLYGYGYENVHELADLLHVNDDKVKKHLDSSLDDSFYVDGLNINALR